MAKAAAKPGKKQKEKPKAGRVIEWLPLMFGNVFLMEVAILPSNKTAGNKVFLAPLAGAPTAAAQEDSDEEDDAAEEAACVASSPAPTSPAKLYLHVHEGRSVKQQYELSDDDIKAHQEFEALFLGAKGLHARHVYPATAAHTFVHKATYFLAPNPSVGESMKAYNALHAYLLENSKCLLAHHIGKGGKKEKGFYPVAIVAHDDGLVMWQLPLADLSYRIQDSIDPAWKSITASDQEVAAFEAALNGISRTRMDVQNDLSDPLARHLLSIRDRVRSDDEMPVAAKVNDFPNFGSTVSALKKARPRKID